MLSRLPVLLLLLPCLTSVSGQGRWITNAKIVDVKNGRLLSASTLQVDDGKIVQVGGTPPDTAAVIDAEGAYLTPGFVDAHIHMFQSGGLYTRPDVLDLRETFPYQEERNWLKANFNALLRRYLACGITSVVDLGGPMYNYVLRDRSNADSSSAQLYLTGPLISTVQPEPFAIKSPPIIEVSSPEQARERVQEQLPFKPDFIKIWYIVRGENAAEKNYPIVEATIEEAHKYGLRVAVHATQLETARLAVEAGADFLVHSVDDAGVDQKFIRLLREQGTVLIPTLIVARNYVESFAGTHQFDSIDLQVAHPRTLGHLLDVQHLQGVEQLRRYQSRLPALEKFYDDLERQMAENLMQLHQGGVTIATGTDAGNIGTLHASSYFDELQAMRDAGMNLPDLLRASTLNAAAALGKQDQFGSIEVGKEADLILLRRNPLEDLRHWEGLVWVMQDGHRFSPQELLVRDPAQLAQQQLNAYNLRNLEAFLQPYAEDVRIYNFPRQLVGEGKAAMRNNYARLFENATALHCELVNRIVMGNTVFDHESVIFREGQEEPSRVTAMYRVQNGKIQEVYFIRDTEQAE